MYILQTFSYVTAIRPTVPRKLLVLCKHKSAAFWWRRVVVSSVSVWLMRDMLERKGTIHAALGSLIKSTSATFLTLTHSKKKKKSRFFYWARNVSTPCQDQARIKRGYPHHKQERADGITAIYMCLRMMRRCNSKFYLWVAFLQFLCVLTMAMFSPYKRCMCDISSEVLQACASSAMIPSSLASNFFALSQFNASMLYYVFVYAL